MSFSITGNLVDIQDCPLNTPGGSVYAQQPPQSPKREKSMLSPRF